MGLFSRKPKQSDLVVEKDKAVIDEAKERFRAAIKADEEQRRLELDDLAFCDPAGQWPDEIKAQREAEGRPCLTVDRTNPFVHQLVNEFRQNRPQPNVNPVGDGADKDTAEILQGLIRHIAYLSNGDVAIDTAFESMGRCGRGYFRMLTEYVDTDSFEQNITIKRIPNLHSVVLDPSAMEPDGSDANFGFITAWLSKDTYKAEHPDSKLAGLTDSEWDSLGDSMPEWASDEGVQVIEYYRRVRKPIKVHLLADGTTVKAKDLPEGAQIEDTRDSFELEVQWFKLNAIEILDSTVWPDTEIPIFPMYGTELNVDGKRTWAGLIRSAKDAQRAFNFWKSAQAETIALAPRAPWVGPKGFMGNMRAIWQAANRRPVTALEYEVIDQDGKPLPPPQRNMVEPPIAAISSAMVAAVDDLKATTGMYDASLGNRESGQSGVAIRQLQRQGQTGNFHFMDNAARTIRRMGRVMVRVAPKIYDTERTVRIVRPDESSDTVTINGPSGQRDKQTGLEKVYDIKVGTYDVTISTGPSYQTKRQENLALLESLMTGPMGGLMTQAAPDLVASMLDFAIAPQLVERLKKTLPPQLQDEDGGQGQIPPQVQAQMQQEAQMNQALTQRVNELQDELDKQTIQAQSAIERARIDADTRIKIAQINAEAGLREAEIKAAVPGAVQGAESFMAEFEDLRDLVLGMHGALSGGMNPHETQEPWPMEAAKPPHQEQGEVLNPLPQLAIPAGADQPLIAGPMAGMEQQ